MRRQPAQLSPVQQYDKEASPLAILTRLQGHGLI
jgi:hypothetical protein